MPHEIHASIRVPLPDDPRELAGALGEIATAWAAFLTPLPATVEATFVVNEVRARPTNGSGAKRGRKPRLPAVSEVRGILSAESEQP